MSQCQHQLKVKSKSKFLIKRERKKYAVPTAHIVPTFEACYRSIKMKPDLGSWRKIIIRIFYFQQSIPMLNGQTIASQEKNSLESKGILWLSFDMLARLSGPLAGYLERFDCMNHSSSRIVKVYKSPPPPQFWTINHWRRR